MPISKAMRISYFKVLPLLGRAVPCIRLPSILAFQGSGRDTFEVTRACSDVLVCAARLGFGEGNCLARSISAGINRRDVREGMNVGSFWVQIRF